MHISLVSVHKQVYSSNLLESSLTHCLAVWPDMPTEWRVALDSEDYEALNRLAGPAFGASSYDEWVDAFACAAMHVNNAGFANYFRLSQVLLARRVLAKHRKD